MRILGIETSCDETGVALVENGNVRHALVATQEVHSRWGGVVPELASRLHLKTLTRMVDDVLADVDWTFADLDGIAATSGPGLIGALLVGVSYAKGLSVALDIPYVGVNHLEGHLWSANAAGEEIPLPALALLVSGGHTEMIRIDGMGRYRYLGATLDDAAGEAFDKVGGLLGIPYPAGAKLSRLGMEGDSSAYLFPIAVTKDPLAFSFSGLKTAASRLLETDPEIVSSDTNRAGFAASFEAAVVKQLAIRVERSLSIGSFASILLAGGVAANKTLRKRMAEIAENHKVQLVTPPIEFCTDNGAMIAWLGEQKLKQCAAVPLTEPADPNAELPREMA